MFFCAHVCMCVFSLHRFIILKRVSLTLFRCSNLKHSSILELVYIANDHFVYKERTAEEKQMKKASVYMCVCEDTK